MSGDIVRPTLPKLRPGQMVKTPTGHYRVAWQFRDEVSVIVETYSDGLKPRSRFAKFKRHEVELVE